MKAIIVTAGNVISMTDVAENGEPLYQIVRNAIGGYMENVYPKGLPEGYVMIVDEEGKLKGNPINQVGSYLYQSHLHGDPIVGDVIILKLGIYQGEYDIVGIPDDEANKLMNELFSNLNRGETDEED
ncbi:MAG: DUF3846 domain-containing protein [Clostridia bacterium]|nr:DUF3846 domain-containing protein [Clostridia bacterium]